MPTTLDTQTAFHSQLRLARWLCCVILVAAVVTGPLDIAEGTSGDLENRLARGPILLLKLATAMSAGLVGLWGLVCVPRVRSILFKLPGLALIAVGAVFLVTCVTSVASDSLPISLVFIAYLMFVPTCLATLDLRGSLSAALIGASLFSLGALFLYIFLPRYGVFPEDMGDGVIVERLGGMSQPNHTGRTALIGALLAAYFIRLCYAPRWLYTLLFCMCSLVGALAMSRTALLAALICFFLLNLDLLQSRAGLLAVSLLGLAGLASVFVMASTGNEDALVRKLLGTFTKTGEIEEVMEVTGRAEIWQRTALLIKGRPITGYGVGSAKVMLPDHLKSTHNILLHPTLSAGVVAGGLTLMLLFWNLVNIAIHPQLIVRALCAYFLISGLTEDTIYETFPGACTLLWLVCCLWTALPVNAPSVQIDRSLPSAA